MNTNSMISSLISLATTALGSGPWGILGMVLAMGGVMGGLGYVIRHFNKQTDAADLDRAGADSGATAANLSNQIVGAKQGLDDLEKLNPPKKPGEK